MELVFRAGAVYFVLLILFRITGRRTLAQINTFDFVLLLIISEATQNAMIGQDYSFTAALLVIITLLLLNVVVGFVLRRSPTLNKAVNGLPLVIVEDGRPLGDRLRQSRIQLADVLEAGRKLHGLARIEQIQYAVLESSGGISIIPRASHPERGGSEPGLR